MRGPLSIAVSGVIGLATEAFSEHKKSQSSAVAPIPADQTKGGQSTEVANDNPFNEDKDDWILDETQTQLDLATASCARNDPAQDIDSLVKDVAWHHPRPLYSVVSAGLSCPVIIPQRRPHTKSRGFVRAYAPALDHCQIDQKIFMDFLEGFEDAIKVRHHLPGTSSVCFLTVIQKEGLFIVANIAVGVGVITGTAFLGTNPFLEIAAFAVHTTIEVGRRIYITHK